MTDVEEQLYRHTFESFSFSYSSNHQYRRGKRRTSSTIDLRRLVPMARPGPARRHETGTYKVVVSNLELNRTYVLRVIFYFSLSPSSVADDN